MPLPITAVFADLPDPRRDTATSSTASPTSWPSPPVRSSAGPSRWEAIAEYGRTKEAFFRRFLPLRQRHPQPRHVRAGLRQARPGGVRPGVRPVDGGGVRGDRAGARSPSTASRPGRPSGTRPPGACTWSRAWAAENRLVLGQAAVPDGSQRDRGDPRAAPHAGPGRGDRDDRRRRVPGRERPDHPRAGAGITCWP